MYLAWPPMNFSTFLTFPKTTFFKKWWMAIFWNEKKGDILDNIYLYLVHIIEKWSSYEFLNSSVPSTNAVQSLSQLSVSVALFGSKKYKTRQTPIDSMIKLHSNKNHKIWSSKHTKKRSNILRICKKGWWCLPTSFIKSCVTLQSW